MCQFYLVQNDKKSLIAGKKSKKTVETYEKKENCHLKSVIHWISFSLIAHCCEMNVKSNLNNMIWHICHLKPKKKTKLKTHRDLWVFVNAKFTVSMAFIKKRVIYICLLFWWKSWHLYRKREKKCGITSIIKKNVTLRTSKDIPISFKVILHFECFGWNHVFLTKFKLTADFISTITEREGETD